MCSEDGATRFSLYFLQTLIAYTVLYLQTEDVLKKIEHLQVAVSMTDIAN